MGDDTEEVENIETEDTGVMEMSDEDFMQLGDPSDVIESEPDTESHGEEVTITEDDLEEEESPEEVAETEDTTTDIEDAEEEDITQEESENDTEEEESEKDDTESKVNFEEEYNKIMGPFKANGRDMTMKSAEDVITLMQMGANYHKKMAGLKPSLKSLKLLEKHDLLDPEKLNYLIDLNNKNPEAITKLLKDSEIDPLDIDVQADSNYKPESREVSDTELELDSVLEGIQDSPKYNDTLNVIGSVWDDASRNTIAANPNIIQVINGHMENGIYDIVNDAVVYERSLGKLTGMSDLDAYKYVGDLLDQQGRFNSEQSSQAANTNIQQPTVQKKPATDAALKKRKQAVSPTKSKPAPTQKSYNPLAMSDEEFLEFDKKNFQ